MHPYIPNGVDERIDMLKAIGKNNWDELFSEIPEALKLKNGLNMEDGLPEADVIQRMKALAAKNTGIEKLTCFMGAGAYDSYIPVAVKHISGRSEFYTAYTPYQPEISQGTLQCIFEFQTMICELTGMDAANASMYDGATAVAEAAFMAHGINNKKKVIVSKGLHPESRQVLKAYAVNHDLEIIEAPLKDGITDLTALEALVDDQTSAVILQNPNFLGQVEHHAEAIGQAAKAKKALFVVTVSDALSLAIAKTPGELGADICVGDGQAFGNGLNYGGPYVGFMATTTKHVRKLPGRICGESKDLDGKRAYVLTLQAREQHIRREKATSNICSNQGLMALTATVYLSLLGKVGLKDTALQSASKTRALKKALEDAGVKVITQGHFFREFAIELTKDYNEVMTALRNKGFLGGYSLNKEYPEFGNAMLLCVTEKRSQAEIEAFATAIKEILEV